MTATFDYTEAKPFSYGTHAAHVAVDPRTGAVELVDFIAIEDIGRVLNPLVVHGQALGAIVQGLGGAFLEHLRYDEDGQLLTASFADYLLPSATDFPNIRGHFMELALAPEIRSAPKARAKAASWRWLPQSATPFPLRCRRFACRYASCRYRRRAFGNSSKIYMASLNKRRIAMMLSRLRPLLRSW